ncbi:MAG: class I SAM-dependent methyltransferase [Acidobacteriota bacterium]
MWDERYAREDYLFGTEPAEFLSRSRDLLRPDLEALAVADGEGRNSIFLAEQGVRTTAFDPSAVAVRKARALAEARRVTVDFHIADMEGWVWEADSYDLVVGIFIQVLGAEARARIFGAMKRTLRPGGRLLLHGYTPKQLEYRTGGPPVLENLYTEELLRDAFADFEIERLESYDAEIKEGTAHVGRSALIDLVARKPSGPSAHPSP